MANEPANLPAGNAAPKEDRASVSVNQEKLSPVWHETDARALRILGRAAFDVACGHIHKTDLSIRPVWHQRADRVQAHILVCFLAYVLWKTLEQW